MNHGTFIEFDFAGGNDVALSGAERTSDNLIPRFRFGYGTLGGFLAGQANSNFADPDLNSETLDFGGDTGASGPSRVAQIRYTIAGPWGSAWSISAENTTPELWTPAGLIAIDTNPTPAGIGTNPLKQTAPNVTFASYFAQPWGHIDFKGVVRPGLSLNDGVHVAQNFVGYGGGISGDVKPGWWGWNKDDIVFNAVAGNGLGRYLNDSSNASMATNYPAVIPATVAAAALVRTATVPSFGAQLGYQHWWLPNLRSNISGGYVYYDVPTNKIGPTQSVAANKREISAHANLIWSPVAFIDAGIEYVYGQRMVVANIKGNEQVLISKFRVKF